MNGKKNLTPKENFDLAVQSHQKNNLQVAKKIYKEIDNKLYDCEELLDINKLTLKS